MKLTEIIDFEKFPISDEGFRKASRQVIEENGVLTMPDFLKPEALKCIREEGEDAQDQAYFKTNSHNVYLTPSDPQYSDDHAFNRQVTSSKGCITDDAITHHSPLRTLYDSSELKSFLSYVFNEDALYPYADQLSSINLHYAQKGQELGWHFDNSSFAVTLMIQAAEKGGEFEYVKNVRNADKGEMNFTGVNDILDGKMSPTHLSMQEGALVLFRGRNSMHRVTPNQSELTRMLVVLAYNSEPEISLSESARMTFYGRI